MWSNGDKRWVLKAGMYIFFYLSLTVSYEEAQIKYVWKNDEDTLRKSPSLTTLNAYLIKNQTTACDQNSWRGKSFLFPITSPASHFICLYYVLAKDLYI